MILTESENLLWNEIKNSKLGFKFRRQVHIGFYIVDFCCFSRKLVIEIDGEYHKQPTRKIKDRYRSEQISRLGYRVIRFWNYQVKSDLELVIKIIMDNLTLSEY